MLNGDCQATADNAAPFSPLQGHEHFPYGLYFRNEK